MKHADILIWYARKLPYTGWRPVVAVFFFFFFFFYFVTICFLVTDIIVLIDSIFWLNKLGVNCSIVLIYFFLNTLKCVPVTEP